jgi:DNA-binding LytR/AlgR family response regulator
MKSKINILIVEDEPLIADDIAFILEDEGYNVVGKAIDTQEALDIVNTEKPDLILLDISLEGDDEDGIDLANIINNQYQIPFVFITSHSDKLTINRVKKTNPCGFILKPFKASEIVSTIAIVIYKSIKNLTNSRTKSESNNSFFIKQGHDLVKVQFSDILYIKAEDNYTAIKTTEKSILASLSMKSLAEKLPENKFLRIHRSYIVNIKKITRISHRFVYINEHEIPLGKGNFQMIQDFITTL